MKTTKKMTKEQVDYLETTIFGITYLNDMVGLVAVAAMEELRSAPICRHEVKSWAKLVSDAQNDYDVMMRAVIGKEYRKAFFEMNQNYSDFLEKDVEEFRVLIEKDITAMGWKHAKAISHVFLLRVMAYVSIEAWKARMDQLHKYRVYQDVFMDFLRMDTLFARSKKLADLLGYEKCESSGEAQKKLDEIIMKLGDKELVVKSYVDV